LEPLGPRVSKKSTLWRPGGLACYTQKTMRRSVLAGAALACISGAAAFAPGMIPRSDPFGPIRLVTRRLCQLGFLREHWRHSPVCGEGRWSTSARPRYSSLSGRDEDARLHSALINEAGRFAGATCAAWEADSPRLQADWFVLVQQLFRPASLGSRAVPAWYCPTLRSRHVSWVI
jgi:hypothetical protein